MPASSARPSPPASLTLPLWALTKFELLGGMRAAAFRFLAFLAFILGCSVGSAPGKGAALSAYATGEAAWQYLGLFAVIWMSLAAARETFLRTDILIFSKPQPTERLVLSRFAGYYFQIVVILAAMFLGAMAGRAIAGGLAGFAAYGVQYVRVAAILYFASCASYCLALLANTPIAGALIALYWIVTIAGKSFLSKAFFPAYTQNLYAYLFLGTALLGLALIAYRRKRRGSTPPALWARIGTAGAFLLTAGAFQSNLLTMHDPPAREQQVLNRITEQNLTLGERVPGFTYPDQNGRPTSPSDFPNKILLIALFQPQDREAALLIAQLSEFQKKYGKAGVQPIAVCLSEDNGAATTFALGEAVGFPIVNDWGTHNASKPAELSPMATAFLADVLPKVVVTDRRHRATASLSGLSAYDGPELEVAVKKRLDEEPE